MAMHVCNQTKNTPCKELQKRIEGQWNISNRYICGACFKTFGTICSLHYHCIKHNGGGSYFFDHVTNTAFPKFDVTSSWSQFEEQDFVNDNLPVLNCQSRSIIQLNNDFQENTENNAISSKVDNSDGVTNFKDDVGKCVTTQDDMHNDEENINLKEAGDKNVNKSEDTCATFKMKEDGTCFVDEATTHLSDLYHQASLTPQADKNLIMPHSVKKPDVTKTSSLQLLEMENAADIPEARTVDLTAGDKHDKTNRKVIYVNNSHSKLAQHEKNEVWDKDVLERKSNDVKGKERKQMKACATNQQNLISSPLDDVVNTSSVRSSRKRKITSKMKDSGYASIMGNVRKEINLDDEVQNTDKSSEECFDKNGYSTIVKGMNKRRAKESKIKLRQSKNKDLEFNDGKNINKKHIGKQSSETGSSDASINMFDCKSRKLKCFSQGEGEPPGLDHEECNDVKEKVDNENESKDNTNNYKKSRPRNSPNKKKRCSRKQDNYVPCKLRKDFECKVCGKVGLQATIKYHEQLHSNKLLECEICRKVLKTALCKASHMKLHGEKKWQCDRCPAAFYRKKYLDSHLNKHDGIMPHMCDLCGAKFTEIYILRRHVANFHNNIRDYSCDICEKKFYRAVTRDNHRKRHFEPSLQCSKCPKKFKIPNDLRKHEFTHSGEKQFFCPLCNQGFTHSCSYNRHMWRIHNIGKEQAKEVKIKNPNVVNWKVKNTNCSQGDKFMKVEDQSVNADVGKKQLEGVSNQLQSDTDIQGTSNAGSNQTTQNSEIIAEINDFSDTIVLELGDKIGGEDTIVIHTEDFNSIDNLSGYIVLDDLHSGGNIVIYSEYTENEIADGNEYQKNN